MRPGPLLLVPLILALIAAGGTRLRDGPGNARASAELQLDLLVSQQARAAPSSDAAFDSHGRVGSAPGRSLHGRLLTTVGSSGVGQPQQQLQPRQLPFIKHLLADVNSNPTQLVYINYHAQVNTTNLLSLFRVDGATMCVLSLSSASSAHPLHRSSTPQVHVHHLLR